MVKRDQRDPYAVECGDRLRRTRKAMGYRTLREFAAAFGYHEDTVGTWETGKVEVPPRFVREMAQRHHGFPDHNWIFDGDARNMPLHLAEQLLPRRA